MWFFRFIGSEIIGITHAFARKKSPHAQPETGSPDWRKAVAVGSMTNLSGCRCSITIFLHREGRGGRRTCERARSTGQGAAHAHQFTQAAQPARDSSRRHVRFHHSMRSIAGGRLRPGRSGADF